MFSRLDVPNCDLVFMRLYSSSSSDEQEKYFLFDEMIQKTFFFLSSLMKPKRSSTIFLSFSRESSMSEYVFESFVESSYVDE
jgi:hypothetical protein